MSNGVTYAKGFTADGVACGIKKNGGTDLAVVFCDTRARGAGVFTNNRVKGHSLLLAQRNLEDGFAQAVVINAGNANACLGKHGDADAQAFAKAAAQTLGCDEGDVLTASTGVIGVPLPVDKIRDGLKKVRLRKDGSHSAAHAIMTTDTLAKQAQASCRIGRHEVRIGGIAKGSGMIHPDMATMIAVITTDALISHEALKKALKEAADMSFNRISVDGDTSVCDKVLLLASGLARNPEIGPGGEDYSAFLAALKKVSLSLARQLAADGEGATKLLQIVVEGAKTDADAHKIASAIARSPLCKTAAFGNDANWGRLLTAAGYSGAEFDPGKVDILIGSVQVCANGGGISFSEAAARDALDQPAVTYTIRLGDGDGTDTMYTCDFSLDYVRVNANYRT